jgi:inhibitor of KinA
MQSSIQEPAAPRLLPLADSAVTVEFGNGIDPAVHSRVLGFARQLDALAGEGKLPEVVEWVPTFRSVTVHFVPGIDDPVGLGERLLAVARGAPPATQAGHRWLIPVSFAPQHAPDLDALAAAKGLSRERVVELMTTTVFKVYMLGFLPGFPYLGGLPPECEVPRLATPRKSVPERSIAVAGQMCAVYPWESPGGWHLLGRTPVRFFDANVDVEGGQSPALLSPGDEVRWRSVDLTTYEALERQAAAGGLPRASLLASAEGEA